MGGCVDGSGGDEITPSGREDASPSLLSMTGPEGSIDTTT